MSKKFIFVGNISPDASKDDILKLMREFGSVLVFKMVLDKESGKPRGYGFCEYELSEQAYTASRSLNGREFFGRPLKVDLSENKGISTPNDTLDTKLCVGTELIRDSLLQIPRNQISDCISVLKKLVSDDPEAMKKVLRQNPTLSLVILFTEAIKEGNYDQKLNVKRTTNPAITQLLKTIPQQQLQQILMMTPQQISQLRPDQQQQIILIQQEMTALAKEYKSSLGTLK